MGETSFLSLLTPPKNSVWNTVTTLMNVYKKPSYLAMKCVEIKGKIISLNIDQPIYLEIKILKMFLSCYTYYFSILGGASKLRKLAKPTY